MNNINDNNNITYFKVFKIWFYANILLAIIGLVGSFMIHLQTKKSLYDTLILLFYSILAGFVLSLPSLIMLLLAKVCFRFLNEKRISTLKYYLIVIIVINALYFLFLWILDKDFFKEWGVISVFFTTISGLLSLLAVFGMAKPTNNAAGF